MEKRITRRTIDPSSLMQLADLPPLLQRIYAARNVCSSRETERSLAQLLPFRDLLDINKAVDRLAKAISTDEKILVIGDFDADGATSTAVAVNALRQFGAKHVDFLVPNRFTFGYGLTPEIVDVAQTKNPHLIITVDNGIASIDGVARANQLGIDVVVTDHHLQGDVLPAACAIVNPNRKGDPFESKSLAGVGVIFYVMLALRAHLSVQINMAQLLDLVALGTVADVVPLDYNNRILVHQGLQRIRAGQARPGIQALLHVAGRDALQLSAMDLGFSIGPRLNAAGRLDDMSLGIACLLSNTVEEALEKAKQLDQLNHERRAIENEMRQQAFDAVDRLQFEKNLPLGVCLYDFSWHQGVVGLVASRVKEKLNRPVIAFAQADENTLKGSARSVAGVHIRDVLDAIATQHPQLLSKFGGHAMAAGLSIAVKNFDAFRVAFANEVGKHLSEAQLCRVIETDGALSADEFTLDHAQLLQQAGPWGQQFPEPLFDGEFEIVSQRLVGGAHLKMVLRHSDCRYPIDAIAFQVDLDRWPNHRCSRAQMTYRLDVNQYRGRSSLQLIVDQIVL